MDNICHTLTGAALGEAGLKRRSRFGMAALLVASNLPDIDVLAFLTDTPPVALRRGWTHGVLAQTVLPLLLTGALVGLHRLRPPPPGAPGLRPGALLVLSYTGVLLHVAMDWLNTYGIRLLMPFSGRWFYGDAVFIVDPWLWLALGFGVVLARRWKTPRPARLAVAVACGYIVVMTVSAAAAAARVAAAWTAETGRVPSQLMVGPVPVWPFTRTVIIDAGSYYQRGTFRWLPPVVDFDSEPIPANRDHPAVREAQQTPDFQAFLVWSRFPYYEIAPAGSGTRVTLQDMRFGGRGIFSVTTVVSLSTPDSSTPNASTPTGKLAGERAGAAFERLVLPNAVRRMGERWPARHRPAVRSFVLSVAPVRDPFPSCSSVSSSSRSRASPRAGSF